MQNSKALQLPQAEFSLLQRFADHLKSSLGENLHSLIVYGSSVRGGFNSETSDINLMIVLKVSTPQAHEVIREGWTGKLRIEPFVVEYSGMHRAARVFALKFISIQNHYHILAGQNPFSELNIPDELRLLLTEQEARNLRMRMVRAYIRFAHNSEGYKKFLQTLSSKVVIVLSDILSCAKIDLPEQFAERLAIFESEFEIDTSILTRLKQLKESENTLTEAEAKEIHAKLLPIIKKGINWMESKWPTLPL